jgi:hypothetical protein
MTVLTGHIPMTTVMSSSGFPFRYPVSRTSPLANALQLPQVQQAFDYALNGTGREMEGLNCVLAAEFHAAVLAGPLPERQLLF